MTGLDVTPDAGKTDGEVACPDEAAAGQSRATKHTSVPWAPPNEHSLKAPPSPYSDAVKRFECQSCGDTPVLSSPAPFPGAYAFAGATPEGFPDDERAADAGVGQRFNPDAPTPDGPDLVTASAQARWAARTVEERLAPLSRLRLALAANPEPAIFALAHLPRTAADSLTAEILPLLDAIRFLERRARRILAPRRLSSSGRPIWLSGVHSEIRREPFGHILVIGPSNFPLFLPGTHVLQALAAGNAVTWKPGAGGHAAAQLIADLLREAGLPRGILRITGERLDDARAALADRPDKVVFTGSLSAGREILATLAETATPSVMELSGSDAVIVLPSAETRPGLETVARAVAFGLRLNGGRVCMSPRRLFATHATMERLKPLLIRELAEVPPIALNPPVAARLGASLDEALRDGATLLTGSFMAERAQRPIVLDRVTPSMAIAQADIFAPVLSLIEIPSQLHAAAAVNECPYGLCASIFGAEDEAEALATGLRVGTVLLNDLIAPTADPRVPFPARGASGFGATRGAEGLLEMTVPKTLLVRRGGMMRHLEPTTDAQVPVLTALIRTLHAGSFVDRVHNLKELLTTSRSGR